MTTLLSWIGREDCETARKNEDGRLAKAIKSRQPNQVIALVDQTMRSDWPSVQRYIESFQKAPRVNQMVSDFRGDSANFGQLYNAVRAAIENANDKHIEVFLSSGTRAMYAIWIMVTAENIEPDITLIQSSLENGVEEVKFPFDLQALYRQDKISGRSAARIRRASTEPTEADGIKRPIGKSEAFIDCIKKLEKTAHLPIQSLILGESGTGKEEIAKYLHQIYKLSLSGVRKNVPFVSLNCATGDGGLTNSLLFGHEKGAFTDAIAQRKGIFEQAQGGTLFLDEIGDLALDTQARLLRVLQERKVTRVGGTREIDLEEIQLISATNKNLNEMIEQGSFREDLYYRINVIEVYPPPLRERTGDVRLLADHFLQVVAKNAYTGERAFAESAYIAMEAHYWPGNVRELQSVVFRSYLNCEEPEITDKDIMEQMRVRSRTKSDVSILEKPLPLAKGDLGTLKLELELHYFQRAQRIVGPKNQTSAGKLLGIDQGTVSKRLKKMQNAGLLPKE